MIHAAQQMVRVADDRVAALAFDMGYESDAAAVVLEFRPIQAVRCRQAWLDRFAHVVGSRSHDSP
jgi:hypothetical protein